MALKGYDIKLSAEQVSQLKQLSRRLSYAQNDDISWPALVRLGVQWVLEAEGDAAKVANNNMTQETT
jgi:hypothetical protein